MILAVHSRLVQKLKPRKKKLTKANEDFTSKHVTFKDSVLSSINKQKNVTNPIQLVESETNLKSFTLATADTAWKYS